MNKRKLLLRCTCSLLLGGMFMLGNIPEAAAEVTGSVDAGLYFGRLDKHDTLPVYKVAGEDDVPYISVEDYLTYLYGNTVKFRAEGSKLIAIRNDTQITFDTATGIISTESWDSFFGSYGDKALPNGILQPQEFNAIAVSTKHPSTETADRGFDIDLAAYGLSMENNNGEVLLPFAVLQDVFAVACGANIFSFNGSDFYDLLRTNEFIYGDIINPQLKMNPYADAYYSGEFAQRKEIPAAYARYAYGTTCLLLDLYYGHKEEKSIGTFDDYIEQNGLKERMLSPDSRCASEAFHELVDILFNSGHDRVELGTNVFDDGRHIRTGKILKAYGGLKPMLEALQRLAYRLADKGVDFMAGNMGTYEQYQEACNELNLDPILLNYIFRERNMAPNKSWQAMSQDFIKARGTSDEEIEVDAQEEKVYGEYTNELNDIRAHIESLKPEDFGSSRVDFFEDTAFIYFETFSAEGDEAKFYYDLPDESVYDTSTFGLFYDAFEKIQKRPWIKKVVIDLSNNGGGAAAALTAALGFMSPDGEVNLTYYHTLNQNYCSEWYHVDTNLDGKFDSQDGFGDKYDFYILTSRFSYSCANALPFFAQAGRMAKIIGEQPGGGDCIVMDFLDAYGHVARMSGYSKLGRMINGKFVSDEQAVKVDYPFEDQADNMYYNYRGIAQWLKGK